MRLSAEPKYRHSPVSRRSLELQEQLNNRGVYRNVFEQSILIDNRPNKSWSLLASLTAELVVVSAMILIPLLYGDHLPDFHWHAVMTGPLIQPVTPPPPTSTQTSSSRAPSSSTRPIFHLPADRSTPIPTTQQESAASGPSLEPPSVGIGFDTGERPTAVIGSNVIIKPPTVVADPPHKPTGPIHVSGGVQMAKLVKQVIPVYPQLAKTARISGVVHLVGIIAKDGTIRNLQLIDGHPLLTKAALDAVAQWIYKPTLLSGEPVEVICPIEVTFSLSK